jgi:hypothetical protein
VTVKLVDNNSITPIGTIFTQSVQAVQGIGTDGRFAVAAEDSLVVFSTRMGREFAFKMQDLYASFHTLHTDNLLNPTTLWAGKWYGSSSDFLYYYNADAIAPVQYGGAVAGITHDVRGMAQIGDTLYVSQNIQNTQYSDSVSYISRVLVSNKTFLNELGRNQPRFLGVSELYKYNGKLYGVCQNTNHIIEYTPSTGVTRTIVCGTANISKGLSWAQNRLTVTQGSTVMRYNITTGALIENLTCLVPTAESVVAGLDGFGENANLITLLGTTDYFSYGKTYTENNGCMSTMANVGIAPEAMAFVRNNVIATQNQNDNTLFGLAPNPTSDVLNVIVKSEISGNITIKIMDILGRTMENTLYNAIPSQISLAYLPKGLYFVEIRTEKGIFIQKIQKI